MKKQHLLYFLLSILILVASTGFRLPGPGTSPGAPPEPPPLKAGVEDFEEPESLPGFAGKDHLRPEGWQSVAQSLAPQADRFGYSWNDGTALAWFDATGGDRAAFSGADDSFAGPISIGFPFKFYEKTYDKLYISTNGFLSFGDGSSSFSNTLLPQDSQPNNLIAPFWDDLVVGGGFNSGEVFYTQAGSPGSRFFVVQWAQVTRRGESDTNVLTFEVLLYENGDILFQYHTLSGILDEATVGIEDADGIDGLSYLYNAAGLSSGKTVRFYRPPASAGLKALPVYQSGFTAYQQASFPVTLYNTGELGADTFDFAVTSSSPDWKVLLTTSSQAPLADTDQDGSLDTGPVEQGSSVPIRVVCQANGGVEVGGNTQIEITARSSLNPGKAMAVVLQCAVPAPFAQALTDGQESLRVSLVWKSGQKDSQVASSFSGSNLALAAVPANDSFIYAWESADKTTEEMVTYSNIEYGMLAQSGTALRAAQKLTDNQGVSLSTYDRLPSLAVAPDGHIGIIWTRRIVNNQTFMVNSNVYFAILNTSGEVVFGPLDVTGNTGWYNGLNLDVPLFLSPKIAALGNNRFMLVWIDKRSAGSTETSHISASIFDSAGSLIKPTASLIGSQDGIRYGDPGLVSLDHERAFLSYTVFNSSDQSYSIAYAVLDKTGGWVKSETMVPGGNGWLSDAVQLSTGSVLLAWTNPEGKIGYVVLKGDSFTPIQSPVILSNPNPRLADYVSVSADQNGNGILTWMDAVWNNSLYYALAGSDGSVRTPPMIFYAVADPKQIVKTSYSGQGNAPYIGSYHNFLSLIRR